MRLYVNRWIVSGFVSALFVILYLGYLTHTNNQEIMDAREQIFHTNNVLKHIEQIQSNALRVEERLGKYIISGDTTFLNQYKEELKIASQHYNTIASLTRDNDRQRVNIDSFRTAGVRKLEIHKDIIKEVKLTGWRAGEIFVNDRNLLSTLEVDASINAMRNEEQRLLQDRILKSQFELKGFQKIFFSLMVAIVTITILLFALVNTSMKRRLVAEQKVMDINKELEAFTYSVSHDLRAPLRSIRGFSEVLKVEYGSALGEEGNRLLDIVMRNSSRMGHLIDDLLEFSRLGRKSLTYSNLNIQNMVEEVKNELMAIEVRKVEWKIGPLPNTRGDFSMIRQVWVNLMSNALKYSKNRVDSIIEIGSLEERGNTIYFITDNGVGFDMMYSDKLFKVFQRLHNVKDFEGTGVGLALAHRIISKHNGRIWATSSVGEGSTFYFSLLNPTL